MQIRYDIQFLRGIAVILVVLYHLQVPYFDNGFLGVDIFFVISGYLMALLYDKVTVLNFYKRRIDRLYPAYAFTLFITLFTGTLLTVPVDFKQLFQQSIAGSFFVSNIYYWNQNSYFDKAAFNPLLNLWSLAVEVQFYLLVPFLYPILRRNKFLLITTFCISLICCISIQLISPKTSFFLMPFRIWEFLIGAYIAWNPINSSIFSLKARNFISLFALIAMILSLNFYNLEPDTSGSIIFGHPSLLALIVTILTGVIIKHGIIYQNNKNFIFNFFIKIGNLSYSIYLVHFPIIVFLNYQPFGGTNLEVDSYFKYLLIIILIFLLSLLSYYFVENRKFSYFNPIKIKLYSFIAIIFFTYFFQIFNLSRYSNSEKNIFSAWEDRDVYRCGKLNRIMYPLDILCKIGNTKEGDKNILLIGNSHADAIKLAFSNNATKYDISTFFVVSNNSLLTNGISAYKLNSEITKYNFNALVLHYSNIYNDKNFRNEATKLITFANSKGIKVFIIAPIPTYSVHIPQTMFNNLQDLGLEQSIVQHREKTKEFWNFVLSFNHLDIDILDPADYLCSLQSNCIISTLDLKPYYFDSNHLTLTGSLVLLPLYNKILNKL